MDEHRGETRFPLCAGVKLRRGQWEEHATENISRHGLFVRSGDACQLNQLIQLKIESPDGGDPIPLLARVMRAEAPWEALANGRVPGMGLELRYLEGEARERWEALVAEVDRCAAVGRASGHVCNGYQVLHELQARTEAPLQPDSDDGFQTAAGVTPDRQLVMRMGSLEQLARFQADILATGELRMNIPYPLPDGAEVVLKVVHPVSGVTFDLKGVFQRLADAKGPPTIRLELSEASVLEAFSRFVTGKGTDSKERT